MGQMDMHTCCPWSPGVETSVCMDNHHWSLSGDPISIPALVPRCGDQCLHGSSSLVPPPPAPIPGLGCVVSGVAALLWCCGAVVLLSPATAPRQSGDVFSDIHCSTRPLHSSSGQTTAATPRYWVSINYPGLARAAAGWGRSCPVQPTTIPPSLYYIC